jgi:hypothetical protein
VEGGVVSIDRRDGRLGKKGRSEAREMAIGRADSMRGELMAALTFSSAEARTAGRTALATKAEVDMQRAIVASVRSRVAECRSKMIRPGLPRRRSRLE